MTRYTEKIDMVAMKKILGHFDDLWDRGVIRLIDDNYKEISNKEKTRHILTKFYKCHDDDGKMVCVYKPAKHHKDGRLYGAFSLQGISRRIRHTVASDLIDIDIKNCHPTILERMMTSRGFTCEKLKEYNRDRDKVLNQLIHDEHLENRDAAKRLVLSVINGCGRDDQWGEWLWSFYDEIEFFLHRIGREFPMTYATLKKIKNDNVAVRTLNHELTTRERTSLNTMITFAKEKKEKIAVLCHDGFMLYRNSTTDYTKFCEELSVKLDMPTLVKKMDEGIDTSKMDDRPIPACTYMEDVDYDDDARVEIEPILPMYPLLDIDPHYTINNFIRDFSGKTFKSLAEFKSKVVPKYCKVFAHFRDTNQTIYRCQDNKIILGSPNVDLFHWRVETCIHPVKLSDVLRFYPTNVPVYDDYGFYPDGKDCYGDECPPNIFNVWTGFKAKRVEEVDMEMIQPFLDHILHVWADDDQDIYEYLLDYFASIIQFPWKKTQVLILLYGLQRIGKNTPTNFFLNKVLGKDWGTDNIGVGLFQDRFNVGLMNQIFTVCNELPQLTTTTRNGVFDTLKAAITDDERAYEIKGGRKWNGLNYVNCICTTNHDFTYNIEQGDGRILALRCSPRYHQNLEYFNNLRDNYLQQINADHLITFLYQHKITHDLRNIPMTQLKQEMIELSLPAPVRFINSLKAEEGLFDDLLNGLARLHDGVFHGHESDIHLYNNIKTSLINGVIKSSQLYTLYVNWCKARGENIMSQTAFSRIVKNDCKINGKHTMYGFMFDKFW